MASSPIGSRLFVPIAPRIETSSPFLFFLLLFFPAVEEKSCPAPRSRFRFSGGSCNQKLQSKAPINGSDGWRRSRRTIRLNLTQLKAFWKFRRNVCSQKRLYRAKFAGIDATTHCKHRPQKLLKEAALPGTNRTVADGLQMVDIFSKMVVITGVNSGCGSIGRRICSQDTN